MPERKFSGFAVMDHIAKLRRRYSVFFNFSCVFVLVLFMYNQANVDRKPILDKNPNLGSPWRSYKSHHRRLINRRLITELGPTISPNQTIPNVPTFEKDGILEKSAAACSGVARHEGYMTHCEFLRDHQQCISGGFFDYVTFFYCDCEKFHTIGFAVLGLWLMVLFYLLGNTAADYFCCNLAKLSSLLKLPPTVAGVTLLPLGNGAPDVFASITAFVGSGAGEVGLNSVLGGAVFVTCVVAGVVSLCAAEKNVQIDRKCFVRDVGFFLFTLISLSLILAVGRVGLWGAILFVLIYMVYAFVVAANELLKKHARMLKLDVVTPLLPVRGSFFSYGSEEESMYSPFLDDDVGSEVPQLHAALPQWLWASHVAIYSNHGLQVSFSDKPRSPWGWNDEDEADNSLFCSKVFSWMEMLLALPRRLTIPIVEDERWSRVYAVASASLAPVLLAFVWNTSHDEGSRSIVAYVLGSVIGVTLGILGFTFSIPDNPPRRYLFPWVSGGFVMSIVWFYIIANELVELLVALGAILGINPSILGLTVLAWGNSMGDLMSNVALALNGGDGVQIAMSGCYAGPMFNTLAGLGISMLFGAWSVVPASYELPRDSSLVFTIGFLVSGLIWALVILQRNDMRPNKMLGFGLLVLYLIFLFVRLSIAIGIISFVGSH